MPDIRSEITNKNFPSAQGLKQFEVEDASDPSYHSHDHLDVHAEQLRIAEMERKVAEARKAKLTGKERLSDQAKRRIEMLCNMSRMTRDVTIDGNVYSLRTLKSKELQEVINASAKYDGNINITFETRKQFLVRGLYKVAGTDISDFLNDDSVEAKLEFLDYLEESVVARLYSEFQKLTVESEEKYGIKTEKDAKEVYEDLKK